MLGLEQYQVTELSFHLHIEVTSLLEFPFESSINIKYREPYIESVMAKKTL